MGRGSSPRVLLAIGVVLAVAGVALVASRATRSHADQASEVRRVVKTYEVAILSGDGNAACAQLTREARAELLRGAAAVGVGSSCAAVGTAMRSYIDSLMAQASPERAASARRELEDPPIEVLSVDGDRATAKVSGVKGHPISLVNDGGGWKIASMSFPGN